MDTVRSQMTTLFNVNYISLLTTIRIPFAGLNGRSPQGDWKLALLWISGFFSLFFQRQLKLPFSVKFFSYSGRILVSLPPFFRPFAFSTR